MPHWIRALSMPPQPGLGAPHKAHQRQPCHLFAAIVVPSDPPEGPSAHRQRPGRSVACHRNYAGAMLNQSLQIGRLCICETYRAASHSENGWVSPTAASVEVGRQRAQVRHCPCFIVWMPVERGPFKFHSGLPGGRHRRLTVRHSDADALWVAADEAHGVRAGAYLIDWLWRLGAHGSQTRSTLWVESNRARTICDPP